jgi:glycine oxidase
MPTIDQLPRSADVVIIGGGVIGLSIARALARRGCTNTVVLERAHPGSEASSAAAGMLAPQVEADEVDDFFRLASASRDLYPAFAASLLEESGIDVELDQTGTLYLAFSADDEHEIERRYAWQSRVGLAIEKLTAAEARLLEPCIATNVRSALRFPADIQVENRRLIGALVAASEQNHFAILNGTAVQSIDVRQGKVKAIETSRGTIATNVAVLAGGAWSSAVKGVPEIPIEPVRGQMLCFKAQSVVARHVIFGPRGYIVPRLDFRLLAGSTSERSGFDRMTTETGLRTIRSNATEISPSITALPLLDSWAGLRPRAPDNLPVLGPCDEINGLVYATGHYRNGILLAPITGELIASVIVDNVRPLLLSAFTADRFRLVTK